MHNVVVKDAGVEYQILIPDRLARPDQSERVAAEYGGVPSTTKELILALRNKGFRNAMAGKEVNTGDRPGLHGSGPCRIDYNEGWFTHVTWNEWKLLQPDQRGWLHGGSESVRVSVERDGGVVISAADRPDIRSYVSVRRAFNPVSHVESGTLQISLARMRSEEELLSRVSLSELEAELLRLDNIASVNPYANLQTISALKSQVFSAIARKRSRIGVEYAPMRIPGKSNPFAVS